MSLRTWRDRAIAGLMLWRGLRSVEVLGLRVKDVDTTARYVHLAPARVKAQFDAARERIRPHQQ